MQPAPSTRQDSSMSTVNGDERGSAQPMFEKLFEFSPDAIFVTDPEGRIRGANVHEREELFGFSRAELLEPFGSKV